MSASRRRMTGSVCAAFLVVFVAFIATWSGGGGVEVTTDADEQRPDAPSRPAALAAPTDGVASRLLPVLVEPSTDLAQGQVVAISGSGFTPGATLGAVLCSAGAAGGGGVAFCELAHYDNFPAGSEGSFADDYVLRRFIETPAEGTVDCGESTDRCLLAVGNINDYDESGGSFISYQGASDPPPPQLVVSPPDGLADGQVVSVKGTGVRAAPDARLRLCPAGRETDATCAQLVGQPDGPGVGGELSVTVQLSRFLGSQEGRIDCAVAPGCVLTTTEYAGRLAVVPIGFDPSAGPSPQAPPPPPTVTETTVPPPELEVTSTVPEPTTTVAPEVTTTVPEPPITVAPEPGEATGPLSDLDLRLELDDTTLAPGESTGGAIVIENNTQLTIVDPSCAIVDISFGLVPTSEPDAPEQGGSAVESECEAGGFPMPPGFTITSDLPAPFTAVHGGDDDPLQPGDYLAVVRFDRVLEPLSTPVTVTP